MSCILTIKGKDFDVDSFVSTSKLKPYKIFYFGQPRMPNKPNGLKHEFSGILIEASNADFANFKAQVNDVLVFLKNNEKKLQLISKTKGIEFSILDFGVELNINGEVSSFTQSHFFPNDLLLLAGKLSLNIELSVYPTHK